MASHVFKTKTLAVYSIQENMVTCEIDREENNIVLVLLVSNNTLFIKTPSKDNALWVLNAIKFLPPKHTSTGYNTINTVIDADFEMSIQITSNYF